MGLAGIFSRLGKHGLFHNSIRTGNLRTATEVLPIEYVAIASQGTKKLSHLKLSLRAAHSLRQSVVLALMLIQKPATFVRSAAEDDSYSPCKSHN
jgi:hypothetical protein